MKLPKTIYVFVGGSGDSEYLDAGDNPERIENDGERVGIYELREIKTKRIVHSLEPAKKKKR